MSQFFIKISFLRAKLEGVLRSVRIPDALLDDILPHRFSKCCKSFGAVAVGLTSTAAINLLFSDARA